MIKGIAKLVTNYLYPRLQFHQEQQHIDALAPLLVGNTRIVRWDGAAEFWTESAEKFVQFMQKLYASDKIVGMF
jgi:hypothetical protein